MCVSAFCVSVGRGRRRNDLPARVVGRRGGRTQERQTSVRCESSDTTYSIFPLLKMLSAPVTGPESDSCQWKFRVITKSTCTSLTIPF